MEWHGLTTEYCFIKYLCMHVHANLFFAIPAYIVLSSCMNTPDFFGELTAFLFFDNIVCVLDLSCAWSQPSSRVFQLLGQRIPYWLLLTWFDSSITVTGRVLSGRCGGFSVLVGEWQKQTCLDSVEDPCCGAVEGRLSMERLVCLKC